MILVQILSFIAILRALSPLCLRIYVSQSFVSKQIPIDADLMRAQLVEIGIFGPKAILNTSPLSSGRVRHTRWQISAGADAPVAPVLTRSLICEFVTLLALSQNIQIY